MGRPAPHLLIWTATLGLCACRPAPTTSPQPTQEPTPRVVEAKPTQPTPIVEPAPSQPQPQPEPKLVERPAWRADEVPDLTDEERDIFWGSAQDESPEVRGGIVKELENVHYTIGNEWTLYAFREDLNDLGGGYVGVGPDQAYLFMGWQRPEFAWLIDYDAAVVRTHQMYRALFAAAQTPKQFVAFFEPKNLEQGYAAIDAMYDGVQARGLKGLLRRQRRYFRFRHKRLLKFLRGVDVPTHLTDQETFDYVKAMLAKDRVRPLLVNLNEPGGMAALSQAASALGVPIRTLYVSNAEEYWKTYDPQFIANVQGLPTDERSLLLRTRLTWKTNRDYMYIVQSMDNYRVWLDDPSTTRVRDILLGHPPTKAEGVNYWKVEHLPQAHTQAEAEPAT